MPRTSEVKSLIKLAFPVAAAHVANMAMQVVDTMFVGHLGPEAIGGVSAANALYAIVMVIGIGALLGVDYLVSRAHGAGQTNDCHHTLVQAVYLAAAISVPFVLLLFLSSYWFEVFGVTPAVAQQASHYMKWLSWSLAPFLLFSAFRQYLQAFGVAAPIMVIMIVANLVNALGNWLFIFGKAGMPALGIAGSGLATCFSRIFMFVALVVYVYRRDRRLRLGLRETAWTYSPEKMRQMIKLGLPAAGQLGLEVGVFATVTILAARLAPVELAAHQIVLHVASVMFMVPLGFSLAAAVRVGHALGEGDQPKAVRVGWTAFVLGALFMSFSGVTLYLLGYPLMRTFTSDQSVIGIGKSLLLVAAFFQLFDGIQVVGAGVLRGIGNTRISMIANFVGHWCLGLPVGAWLCFQAGWGARGLWVGLCVGLTSVALSLLYFWAKQAKNLQPTIGAGLSSKVM